MKRILFLSVFSCLSMVMYAQHEGHNHATAEKVSPAADVAIKTTLEENLLLKEAEHDFGKIPQGKPVTYVFEVSNTGKTALKIDNVQASCGCTTPEWDKEKAIDPGMNSKITVGYNAAAEGPFTKFITITYNGTQTKQLTIKGEVWKTPAASAPANAGLNDLKN
jgi:hypothetical protein